MAENASGGATATTKIVAAIGGPRIVAICIAGRVDRVDALPQVLRREPGEDAAQAGVAEHLRHAKHERDSNSAGFGQPSGSGEQCEKGRAQRRHGVIDPDQPQPTRGDRAAHRSPAPRPALERGSGTSEPRPAQAIDRSSARRARARSAVPTRRYGPAAWPTMTRHQRWLAGRARDRTCRV